MSRLETACPSCGQTIPDKTLLATATRHFRDSSDTATVRIYETRAGSYKIVISDTMDSHYDAVEHDDPDEAVELAYAAIQTWYRTTALVDDTPQARALAEACDETGIW